VLSRGFKLDNLLYAPQLTCYLNFMIQLINESSCIVEFSTNIYLVKCERLTNKEGN